MRTVLLEAFLVALVGAALAFAANALSPRGLGLNRNCFDYGAPTNAAGPLVGRLGATNAASALELLAAQGIRLADSNTVIKLFHDPRREQHLVAFIDARDDEHYQGGHIPGAYQFDHIYPQNYLATILPVCNVADEILVYCNGGECEDSVFATRFLLSAGVPARKLMVYPGGIAEWSTNGMPVEAGERNSGRLLEARK